MRYADDFVLGFQHRGDAETLPASDAGAVWRSSDWKLHPDKTRLIEFGRFAAAGEPSGARASRRRSTSWASRTVCGKTRKGAFTIQRVSIAKRMRAKLQTIKEQLQHAHAPPGGRQWDSGYAPWCKAGSITTPCPATSLPRPVPALKWLGSGGTPCGVAASKIGTLEMGSDDAIDRPVAPHAPRSLHPYPESAADRHMTRGKSRMR